MVHEDAVGAGPRVSATARFHAGLPVAAEFDAAVDMARYAPLPDDWRLGLADVVTSTEALGAAIVNVCSPRAIRRPSRIF